MATRSTEAGTRPPLQGGAQPVRTRTRSVNRPLKVALVIIAALAVIWIILAMIRGNFYEVGMVSGSSMWPTYQSGDAVIVKRGQDTYPKGSVVAAKPEGQSDIVIKRITGVYGDRTPDWPGKHRPRLRPHNYWLSSDNPQGSIDSRTFGPVHRDEIMGIVTGKTTKLDWILGGFR